jgi:hypothetical protein
LLDSLAGKYYQLKVTVKISFDFRWVRTCMGIIRDAFFLFSFAERNFNRMRRIWRILNGVIDRLP